MKLNKPKSTFFHETIFPAHLITLVIFLSMAVSVNHAMALEAHKPEKVLRVGIYNNKPKIFQDRNRKPAGIFIEVLEHIASRENWKLTYVPCNWETCLDDLEKGDIDLMPDVAFSLERSRRFRFHREPVLESWSQVYASSDEDIKEINDLHKKRIAVLKGSIQQSRIPELINGLGYRPVFVPVNSYDEAFSYAKEGKADAAITNQFFGNAFYKKYGLDRTSIIFNPASLYVAASRGTSPDVSDTIDRYVTAMKSTNGSVWYEALDRWISISRSGRTQTSYLLVNLVIGVTLLVTLFIIIILRKKILAQGRRLRETMENLRHAQKLESVGRLAGGIAHDFNNLLSIILGYGEMILKDMENDDVRREQMEQIVDAGLRAQNLTRQLLAFSRKQVLEKAPVDINQMVSGMEKFLVRVIGEDIIFTSRPSHEKCQVMADRGQLEQVIMNMVVNARDAMPRGGTLSINVELVMVHETNHLELSQGEYAVISIMDTGKGMNSTTMEKIFEPFFTTKDKEKGTGLGLATSYGIIRQHGGSIDVKSSVGKGSTFNIYLPLSHEETMQQEQAVTNVIHPQGTETILLVEDDQQVRNIALAILEQQDYRVIPAGNGEKALAVIDAFQGTINLLLTDVIMPGMNGMELSKKVQSRIPGIKILFMSGYTDDLITEHHSHEPDIHFIQKPFTVDSLAVKVRSVLDS